LNNHEVIAIIQRPEKEVDMFSSVRTRGIAVILTGGFLILGCAREPLVARVNGEAITKKEVTALLSHGGIKEGLKTSPEEDARYRLIKQEILNQLINERIVLQAARKEDIKVDRKDIMDAYTKLISGFPKEEDYLKRLKERGMSKDMILRSIEKDLTIKRFKDSLSKGLVIPDNEVKDYFDKNPQNFTTPEEFRLSVIKTESIEEATKVEREIEKGAGFEEMAKKYPAGHTAPMAGETGWVTIDTFPPDMAGEIRGIKVGTFGGPIKGREGYYLIKVQEKKEKRLMSFEEVKENIRHLLTEQRKEERFQAWLQEVRKKAKIEVFE